MRLYFLRHGIAEDRSLDGTDASRRLTPEGVERMRREAEALSVLSIRLDAVVTSPLLRALETAEIVAEKLGMADRVEVDPRLAGGFGLGDLQAIFDEHASCERLMLVGHEPTFSMVSGRLVGGAAIDLKKGGLIVIDIDVIEPGRGRLKWLVPPAVLVACAD